MVAGAIATIAHLLVGSAAIEGPSPKKCVKISDERLDTKLRPVSILSCDYDEGQLARRLLSMFALPEAELGIDAVERVFSLTQLATLYDHSRSADYIVQLKGRDGQWEAQIAFSEQFFPLDASRRPRFRAGTRPTLSNPRIRGEMTFRLTLLSRLRPNQSHLCVLKMDDVVSFARRNHWRAETVIQLPMDGVASPTTDLRRARSSAGGNVDQSGCVTELTLRKSADRGAN
ncbi:hypothetical protein [Novosphingobium soli]|uniref:Uncharacterized protein n=1 Tax=Novosphingobium soli TaxID=574956 RepID=A0ABV6CYZ9_9SPHN